MFPKDNVEPIRRHIVSPKINSSRFDISATANSSASVYSTSISSGVNLSTHALLLGAVADGLLQEQLSSAASQPLAETEEGEGDEEGGGGDALVYDAEDYYEEDDDYYDDDEDS